MTLYGKIQKYLFKLLCAFEKAYVVSCMFYDTHIVQPWHQVSGRIYEGYITRVERLDLLVPHKKALWCISVWEQIAGVALFYFFPYWFQVYAKARLISVFEGEDALCGDNMFRVFVHGYPHAFLCKSVCGFEVPYDVQHALFLHKQASKRYILVLIDGREDVTSCFKKHCSSFTEDLGLTTTEFIALACLDANNVPRYMDYLAHPETNVVVIDDHTFEERVFKKTQKIVI